MKTGVIDVGGGLRDIFGAGIFDYCMEYGIHFDYCLGVSAGSANIASYLAGQKRRNWVFYYDYSFRSEYMSMRNLLKSGSYIDMDYVYGDLSNSNGENPLDYQSLMRNPAEWKVVATRALDGSAKYFDKSELRENDYGMFKASSSIPVVCRPYDVDGVLYFDGALSDPVPVRKALADGCDRIVLILTKPKRTLRSPDKDIRLARLLAHQYPLAAENLRLRAQRYNAAVSYAMDLEKEGSALILAPEDISGVDTLKRDKAALLRLYEQGYHAAEKLKEFLR